MSMNMLSLVPLPPFRLNLTVWALRRRPDNAIDRWDGQTYRHILERWHLYGGLVYFHLLLDRLGKTGFLRPGPSQLQTSGVNSIDFQDAPFTRGRTDGT